ncbi:hypothetical protein TNCT6_19080 [Streptomyces sp. 6-11-2]|nr:hypothetical protein TNCT6_19080 [Streptomyces sp. 6-11-2]
MGTRAVRTVAPPSFSALLTSVLMLRLPGSSAEATDVPSAPLTSWHGFACRVVTRTLRDLLCIPSRLRLV